MKNADKISTITMMIWYSITQNTEGVINMQGCTEAFFRMTCPDDDILQVYDVRFSEVEPGHPCAQRKPENAIVPKEMTEQCLPNNKTQGGRLLCSYLENICEGKTECVFYISPHLIGGREVPTVNSEVIIKYECKPGKKRKRDVGAASFVAVVCICVLLSVGGLLMWRQITHNPSDYIVRTTTNQQTLPGQLSHSTETSSHHQSQGAEAAVAATAADQVSVELRASSAGISHIQI